MVKKVFHTPHGKVEKELAPAEEQRFREIGDRDVLKEDYKKANTTAKKLTVLAKALGFE